MPTSYEINRRILQIRHLPKSFTQAQSTALLKGHGAQTVTFQRRNVFAFFEDQVGARQALMALHQLHLNDSVLLVTFARADDKSIPVLPPVLAPRQLSEDEEMIRRLHAIAPHLGLDYILNPMVKYKYPSINDTILANICEALRRDPNFYTQVLHLMNKMSMKPPFKRNAVPSQIFKRPSKENATQVSSESGSDLSDLEDSTDRKRRKRQPQHGSFFEIQRKPVRKPKTLIPSSILLPGTVPVDVTECFDISHVRKVEIAKIPALDPPQADQEIVPGEGFGRMQPSQPEEDETSSKRSRFDFKSLEPQDLESAQRLAVRDSIDHPAFRNYETGDPSKRLYVKNLHRSVTEDDLFRVFGQFVPEDEPESVAFDIKLMKFGRMREQAFVTFGSVSTSSKALELTNRLFLKGKPMSVQFAKD